MIISKYDKSYDTADGSEQQYQDPGQPKAGDIEGERRNLPTTDGKQGAERLGPGPDAGAAGERWEDDGGPLRVQPPVSPLEYSAKPGWSVLSLRDLNLAVRLGDWPDNPAHLRRAAVEAERAGLKAIEVEAERVAAHVRAERNRDRNPWENT